MISPPILIFAVLAAIFVSGAAVGQLWLRARLRRLERARLERERLLEKLKPVSPRNPASGGIPDRFERAVREEIESMLGDIEKA